MFDPTIYENLKVVLEGAVYDLDLAGAIRVTARQDLIDLANISRTYRLVFQLNEGEQEPAAGTSEQPVEAEVVLSTCLSDLAGELMNLKQTEPGCSLDIFFHAALQPDQTPELACPASEEILKRVWGNRFQIRQTISFDYEDKAVQPKRTNRIQLLFGRRFDEKVMEDVSGMLDHTVLTLTELSRAYQ